LLSFVQFGTAGGLAWIFGLLNDPFPREFAKSEVLSIVYLCVMCTAVGYVLQTFGQKYTPPSSAALIMTLESVFGAIISVALGFELLNASIVTGFALIFAAVIISETKLDFLRKPKDRQKLQE
jgi:drug/metabolite transporter (DMT)-like permease